MHCPHRAVRLLVAAFCLVRLTLPGAERDHAPVLILDDVAGHGSRVAAILDALATGDAEPLAACPSELFLLPLGWPHPHDDQMLEHWTVALRRDLTRAEATVRDRALATIDHRLRTLCQTTAPCQPATVAPRFLPAPTAIALLETAADQAFDLGRLDRFLAIVDLLPQAIAATRYHERRRVAIHLRGLANTGDVLAEAFRPGPLQPLTPRRTVDPAAGITVRWEQRERLLVARDPWQAVRWQRLVRAGTRLITGSGGAAAVDRTTMVLIDENGIAENHALEPEQRLLGIRNEVAWLARDRRVTGVPLHHSWRIELKLPEPPVSAPAVFGHDSLWLGRTRLSMIRNGVVVATWQHDLCDPAAWRFVLLDDRPGLRHPDGRHLALRDLRRALTEETSPVAWAEWTVRAGHPGRAWDRALALPPSDDRFTALRRILTVLPDRIGDDTQQRILLLSGEDRPTLHALHACWRRGLLDEHERAHLLQLATRFPDTWLCADPQPSLLSCRWQHRWTGRQVVRTLDARLPPIDDLCARGTEHHPTLGTVYRVDGSFVHLEGGDDGATLLRAHAAADGAPYWQIRWDAPPMLPSRSMRCRNGYLVVAEGQHRLHLVDLRDGSHLAAYRLPAHLVMPSQVTVAAPDRLAVLHPIGINTHLTLIVPDQTAEDGVRLDPHRLPTPARALHTRHDGFEVELIDGRRLAYPGAIVIDDGD